MGQEADENNGGISDNLIQRSNIDHSSGKMKLSDNVIQRAAIASDEGVAVANVSGDVNVEINKILQYQETIYCLLCGVCVVKTGTFRCSSCGRAMCRTHRTGEQAVCSDCGDLQRQNSAVQESFTDKRTRKISFDTAAIQDMKRAQLGNMKASLIMKDDFGVEKVLSLNESGIRNYYRVGRDLTNDIILPEDDLASRNHAQIIPTREGFYIRDSCSTNGVYINKKKITQATRLKDGDVLLIGRHVLYFSERYLAIVYLNGPFKGIVGLLNKIRIKKDFQIGRCHTNEIQITQSDELASRHHARIIYNNGSYFIEDIGSINGTFVDGQEIEGMARLEHGAMIQVGDTRFGFRLENGR